MKNIIIILNCLLITIATSYSQSNYMIEDPDVILQKGENTPEVLLVGTFHFAYYGLDAHVTAEEDQVNVLSPDRQKEMKQLVDHIAKFRPTKILVESGPNTGYLMARYRKYIKQPKSAGAREVDQIAFPLMQAFDIDTLYGVDARTLAREMGNHKDSLAFHPFLDNVFQGYDYKSEDRYSAKYNEWYDRDDKITLDNDLLTYFKHMNSDKVIDRGWGAYLIGDFKNQDYKGTDALMLNWYSRNLRIYRNVQMIAEPGDRVMILFGSGHMTILKNLFDCSPEYNLVKFGNL